MDNPAIYPHYPGLPSCHPSVHLPCLLLAPGVHAVSMLGSTGGGPYMYPALNQPDQMQLVWHIPARRET